MAGLKIMNILKATDSYNCLYPLLDEKCFSLFQHPVKMADWRK